MVVIIKILHSIFFIILGYIYFCSYNEKKKFINAISIYWMVFYLIFLIVINHLFVIISNDLLAFLLMFSFGMVVLQFIANKASVFAKKSKVLRLSKENGIKDYILKKLFIALLVIYQLLLIWDSSIFEGLTNR